MCQRYMYLFIFVYFLKYIWFVLNQGQFRCRFLHGNFFCPVCNGKISRVSKLVLKGSMSMLVAYKADTVNPRITPRGLIYQQRYFGWGPIRAGGLFERGGLLI